MADPISIIGLAGTVLSTGVGAIGASQQAKAQEDAARYQQRVAENNAKVARDNAAYAAQASRVNAQNQDRLTQQALGKELAGAAASGFETTTGSPVDVRTGTEAVGRLTTLQEIQRGNLQARQYETQATGFGAEAGLESAKAGFASQAGTIDVAKTFLSGVGNFASKWQDMQRVGVSGGSGSGGV
jgi:hypothetical protein